MEDKVSKMRETLRLMSLSRISYAMSFFIVQGFIAIFMGLLILAVFFGNVTIFPQNAGSNSIQFAITVTLYALASIPHSMAISTLFSEPKMANQVGGLLLLFPQLFFIFLAAKSSPVYYFVYLFYWLPVTPACALIAHQTMSSDPAIMKYGIISLDWMNVPLTWMVLILNIPFWFMIYLYLDSTMPSEYGINLPHCFCLSKKR